MSRNTVTAGVRELPTDAEKLAALRSGEVVPTIPVEETPVLPTPTPVVPEIVTPAAPASFTAQDILGAIASDPALLEAIRNMVAPAPAAATRTKQAYNAGSANAVPSCRRSTKKVGYVEFTFDQKPDEATRTELKAAGFRWSKFNSVWYGPAATIANHAKLGALVQSTLSA